MSASLFADICTLLHLCWKLAAEIISETEKYIASLSSLTITVEAVFRFKKIVSTSDMIEGIHDITSKLVESMNPFANLDLPHLDDLSDDQINTKFNQVEAEILQMNDSEYENYKNHNSILFNQMALDVEPQILESMKKYQTDLRLKNEKALEAENLKKLKEQSQGAKKYQQAQFSPISVDEKSEDDLNDSGPESENHKKDGPRQKSERDQRGLNNLTQAPPREASEDLQVSEEPESESEPATRFINMRGSNTLEHFLGQTSFWKRFQKAVKSNPNYKDKQNAINLTGFAKKLENNYKTLKFLFSQISDDDLENFLKTFKDINKLISRYNKQKLTYQNIVDLISEPGTRLKKTDKKKREKGDSKGKPSLISEIYADLDKKDTRDEQKIEEPEPSLGEKRQSLDLDEEAKQFMKAIEIKRIKPVSMTHPRTILLKLGTDVTSKVMFLDDRAQNNPEKASFADVCFYTTELTSLVSLFPDFTKPLKFRISEFKKNLAEVYRDYTARESNSNNMIGGFCFMPVSKIPNSFYSEFEKNLAGGYACAPNMHIYLAHCSSVPPDVFSKLNIYIPKNDAQNHSDLFVFFLKKIEIPNAEQTALKFDIVFESDDSTFQEVKKRIVATNELHSQFYMKYQQARFFKVQPQIYYKMGEEIVNFQKTKENTQVYGDKMDDPRKIQDSNYDYPNYPPEYYPSLGYDQYYPPAGVRGQGKMKQPGTYYPPYPGQVEAPYGQGYDQPGMPHSIDPNYASYMAYYQAQLGYQNQNPPQFQGNYPYPPQRQGQFPEDHQAMMPKQSYQGQFPEDPQAMISRQPYQGYPGQYYQEPQAPQPMFKFEVANEESKPDELNAEDLEIKEMIESQELGDLVDLYQEADDSLKESMMKVMKLIRRDELGEFLKKLGLAN